jgi:hypothetical protein
MPSIKTIEWVGLQPHCIIKNENPNNWIPSIFSREQRKVMLNRVKGASSCCCKYLIIINVTNFRRIFQLQGASNGRIESDVTINAMPKMGKKTSKMLH